MSTLYQTNMKEEDQVRYIGKVHRMGQGKVAVSVPREYWSDVQKFIGPRKLVWVTLKAVDPPNDG